MKKYDDVDWHTKDATNDQFAAAHIALFFVWLANNGYLKDSMIKESGLVLPLSKDKTPTYYLEQYSDGKLVSNYLTDAGIKFVESKYDAYANDFGLLGLISFERDHKLMRPYNVLDTWQNVEALDDYLKTSALKLSIKRMAAQ